MESNSGKINPENDLQPLKNTPEQSVNLGLVSTILGIISVLGTCAAIAMISTQPQTSSGIVSGDLYITAMMLICPALGFVAFAFGAGGLFQQHFEKTYSIIGLVLNGVFLLVGCGIFLLIIFSP